MRNTSRGGIVLSGNGNTVSNITQTLLLDNFVHENKGIGIQLNSAHSSVTNNEISHNNIGVFADANNNLISDNDVSGNSETGVQLASSSSATAILRNIVSHNGANGIDFDGSDNFVYDNTLSNQTNLTDRSSANYVVAHGTPLNAPTSKYFYPPTIDNQHNDPILNGVTRTDITVGSGSINDVQTAYNAALAANPGSFIVLHMSGTFTMDGTSPLTLSSNTAVLLNGTINVTSKPSQVITDTNPASFVSISGGTIDLHGQGGITGIYFPSTSMANIDHVTVINGGVPTTRTSGGMIQLQRGGGYNILYRNTVNMSGGRCLWTQYANAHYVVLENQLSSCNMDAVDSTPQPPIATLSTASASTTSVTVSSSNSRTPITRSKEITRPLVIQPPRQVMESASTTTPPPAQSVQSPMATSHSATSTTSSIMACVSAQSPLQAAASPNLHIPSLQQRCNQQRRKRHFVRYAVSRKCRKLPLANSPCRQ
ncbi:MAG TPA: right-handed parallel beta-helix repeat-containing protein [Edaphobacter sp.]|nr:right-handed parallel beta-helix repeat-containing protein [Edaphobacter sp.]